MPKWFFYRGLIFFMDEFTKCNGISETFQLHPGYKL